MAPILIWPVFRFHQGITFSAVLLVSSITIISTVLGYGPFAGKSLNVSLIELQLFVSVLATTIFILSGVIIERKEAAIQLSLYKDQLEVEVEKRTAELTEAVEKLKKEAEERKQLEGKLIQSQKMKAIGTLAGGIAHDFNNLLVPILGYSQLLQIKLDPQSDGIDYVKNIESAAKRAKEIVQKILIISKSSMASHEEVKIDKLVEVRKTLLGIE